MTENEIVAQRYRELEALNRPKRWGCLQWLVVLIIVAIAAGLAVPATDAPQERSKLMLSSSDCRQIIICLKNYAGDHDGNYPDGPTANDAFRELFKIKSIDTENPFAAPSSPYHGDNNIGTEPEFLEALKPGENHWAMTRGLNDSSSGNAPLVFENPSVASWPPLWNVDVAGQAKPGRCWKSGKIIIGRNDGSVSPEKLAAAFGPAVPLAPIQDGKDLFSLFDEGQVIDIAR